MHEWNSREDKSLEFTSQRKPFISGFYTLLKKIAYLSIWLRWALAEALGIFSWDLQILSCGVWHLDPWAGIDPGPPALGAPSLSPWTTREGPGVYPLEGIKTEWPTSRKQKSKMVEELEIMLGNWKESESERGVFLVAQTVKNPPAIGRPGFDPWVRKIPWRRKWQPTPVLLPGKFRGWRSLVGYSPWGCWVGHDWGLLDRKPGKRALENAAEEGSLPSVWRPGDEPGPAADAWLSQVKDARLPESEIESGDRELLSRELRMFMGFLGTVVEESNIRSQGAVCAEDSPVERGWEPG